MTVYPGSTDNNDMGQSSGDGQGPPSGARRPSPSKALPAFDPNPSAEFGAKLLRELGAPFALIGRVAMWALLPKAEHEFTKDVDFAVLEADIEPIRSALVARGFVARPLPIGGLAVRTEEIRVDFIDRHEGGLGMLFRDAIADAAIRGSAIDASGEEVPVIRAEYLVALKLATGEDRDEQHVMLVLRSLPELDLAEARAIVTTHGGTMAANRLDALARRAGRADARPDYRSPE